MNYPRNVSGQPLPRTGAAIMVHHHASVLLRCVWRPARSCLFSDDHACCNYCPQMTVSIATLNHYWLPNIWEGPTMGGSNGWWGRGWPRILMGYNLNNYWGSAVVVVVDLNVFTVWRTAGGRSEPRQAKWEAALVPENPKTASERDEHLHAISLFPSVPLSHAA